MASTRGAVLRQLGRFSLVGGLATLTQYAILVALVQLDVAGPVLASATGFAISAAVNYALNYLYTFGSHRSHLVAVPLFVLIAGLGLALNTALMALLTHVVKLHYLASQILTTGTVFFWNFYANRRWTFD